ncbi:MAG: hypothetical protein HUJ22_01825 [Gracilimonas sp.]|uniref:DUF4412 domain-containing protein n=1 Tax=Gracilimonas sp. TaxID=1974203 RepID=UPI00199F0BB8|nr:DUF4412 domain-containing protein [Gracilimonas sp.]MBD3615282.1 hypothetical protein [Gracilimonas sp.]
MIKRRLFISVFALFMGMFSTTIYAQFEGQISMNVYSEDDGETEVNELNLYATADRIMIKGEENFDVMDKMSTDGLLIRNDLKDFIIMTGKNQALQVTKVEIEGLVEMLASWSGESEKSSNAPSKTDYSFSDRTQTILGYETAEMIVRDTENPEKHLSIWLAPDIDIDWGMMAERWNNMPESVDAEINGVTQDVIFKGKNFPLLIEAVDGNERTKLMEVSKVNKSSVAKAMVEIPSGVTLMSFKDYVFKMMMEQ